MKKIAIFSGLTIILAMLLLGSMIPAALADEPAKGEFPDVIDLGAVQKEIEAKGLKWTAGETSKSGLSEEQKDRLRGLKVAPKSEKAGTVRLPTALRAIPYGTFDWRNKDGENWLTPVKDQGNCGSCWAFAALGSVESLINIERSNTTIDIDLSEQHLVSDCSSAGDCGGGYPDEALDYIRSNGVPEETCSPYRAANSPCDPCPNWVDRAWKIGSWSWVEASQAQRTEAYKWALREYGPMVVGLYAPDDMFYYTGGIYEPAFSPEFGENLNHAVVLVGYDDAGQYWIIKNSWGEGWGEDGYGKVSYGVLEQYDYALVADGTDGPDIPVIPQPTVIVTPAAAGAVAQYQIDFVAGEALTAGLDTITIAFPLGTTLPVSVSHHYIIVNGNILTVDPSVTGQSVTMITPADIPAFGQYTVVIAQASGIRNPSVAGDYTLDVSTSQEPEAQTSYPYSIGPQVTSGIQVQVLNQVGAPAQYANVFAYSDTSQCPIAGVGTGESGSAWLDIPNGAYTLVAFSGNDHFLVVKEDVNAPSSVTLDTEETVSVEFDCSDFQGNDLNASIFLSPYNCSFCMSLGEVSNGHLTADVTPMTYHQAHAWSWSDLYYLFRQDVTIGEGSIIEFHAAQMPTGQASINLAGFSSMWFAPFGPESGCAPCLTVSNGSAVVMSAATYNVIGELFKNDTDGNQWGYWLGRMTDSPIAVPENGSVSIAAGGNFAISTTPDKSGYSAGEQVVLSNRFADSLGNQLNEIYVQQIASSGQEQNPVLSDKTLPGISCCGSVQDQQSPLAAGAVYPRIVVTDPNGLIIVDESSWNIWCQWNGYSFTLPANAIGGTYSVALTLDTGPHQGTITAGATFQVGDHGIQVQVLNQAGAPAQYANVFAYSNISGPPVAMATTNQSGSASLDVPNGSNYTLVVSSSADHFLVTKEGVAAPCSATINTQDTVGVTFDCRNLNGNAFDADILLYLYGHVALLGSTGADGQLQASITGMTYPVVQALSPSALYFLYRTSVTVGEGSVIEFHAYQMPTGRITIDLVGFSKVIEPYWSGDIVIPDGSSIVVSPGIYPISGKLRLTAGNANEWDYSLAARLVGVTQGGVSVFQAGGAFTAATAPGQASYWAGETVTLQNRVTDAFGNRITSIDVGDYEAPASWQSDSHFLGQSTELAGYAFERASVQDIGWTRVNPKIVVSDPTGGTVLDEMSPQAWGDYSFDLATEAAGGTWSVALSLDTGPHQGLIDASNGFAVNGLGSISGHVYDQHGQPIPNVLIVTKGAGGYAETTTQSDGAYRLAGLRTGTYWVFTCASCSGLNYIDEEYGNPVSVTAPNNTPNINFTLDLGGTISGHVYQSDGVTPIDNVDVYAYLVPAPTPPPPSPTPPPTYTPTSHPASGELTGNPGVKPGTADKGNDSFAPSGATNLGTKALMASDGSYTILGLQTGNYVVYAVAEGYIREYYNGVWNSNEATQVSVTVEQNTIGIDFRLDLGGTISGYVYQADSVTPISGVFVSAYDPNGGYDGYTWTASDGSYTIRGLPTGNYRVEAYADGYIREYYQKTSSYQQATPVSVTAPSNTPNINFTLDLGGSISGHVYQSDGVTPIAGAWINANLIDGNYGMGANTASNGSYTIRGLVSGNYRVEANATDYIREYYQETYRYDQSTPVSVTAPNNTPNINFSLDLGGTISGHVYQSDGVTPIAGASVYCYTEDSGGYKGGTSTAPDGSYNIRGLPSGNYRVEANATGYIREYYQETSSYDQATPVAVTMPNNTPNINFTLDLGGTISGHVYRSDGVTPIAGAWINANLIDGNYGMGATTASDGSYTIRGLPSGSYRVEANATDYIREYYQETFNYQQATPVSVTMPNNTPNINFTLDLGGTISGHVYQSDGTTPIAGAWVNANLIDGNYGMGANTASNGSYTIRGLPSGSYRVEANATDYIREYYQETFNYQQATPVSVTMPNNTPNINFTLDLGGTISGHVYQSDGVTPIDNVSVYAYMVPESAPAPAPTPTATPTPTSTPASGKLTGNQGVKPGTAENGSDYFAPSGETKLGTKALMASDGSYTITGLRTGNYLVYAVADGYIREFYNGTYNSNNATSVSVTAPSNTPNINFSLDLGGTISGHVYRSDGVTPIAGAWVGASGLDVSYGQQAGTASDGSYTIRGLPSGNYRVEANADGYIREYYQEIFNYDQATPVSVTMPNNTPNINFTLDLGGTISGHVYQSDGVTPIAGAWINAGLIDGNYGMGATTASDGSYTIRGLVSGSYRVEANATDYIREYYQETSSYDRATPVAVTMPNNTPNINFTLDLGGTISGHIYQSDGTTPIAGAWVNANLIDGNYGMGANTASNGSYTIRGLISGNYRVEANADGYIREYYQETSSYQQATPVSVTAPNNTPNINFSLDLGGSISGHVYQSDGMTPIAGAWVSFELLEESPSPMPKPPQMANTAADGSYTIRGLVSGTYRVQANADGYIREYYQETFNYQQATPVSVTAPNDTPNINFSLDLGGSISGHVYQSDGVTPIAYILIEAIDAVTKEDVTGSLTQADGYYKVTGLPAGGYLVRASAWILSATYLTEWYNNVRLQDQATPVSVTVPNDTPNINFTLEQGGPISGVVKEAKCTLLVGATVTLEQNGIPIASTTTDNNGVYNLMVPAMGTYQVRVSKSGFRSETQQITVGTAPVTLDFTGDHSLMPNAPSMSYALGCVNQWLYPTEECGLSMSKALNVVDAWLNPVE